MASKVFSYPGKDVVVTYDLARCIHVGECVKGLPRVFNPKRKPWVEPDNADAEQLFATVSACPSGALQARYADGREVEAKRKRNELSVEPSGPVYAQGDLQLLAADGGVLGEDTRVALCRCGASKNKPYCDNSHADAGFEDTGVLGELAVEDEGGGGRLKITVLADGPLLLDGPFEVRGAAGGCLEGRKGALCRCGASENKPFCDGSHGRVGFAAE